ncbi:MAG: helix-turn-helix domain-containing protein [Acidobacteriota bacterium]
MELLTVEETAQYLKMNPEVIRRWLREKRLPGIKIGKEWRIAKEDIDAMLKKLKS